MSTSNDSSHISLSPVDRFKNNMEAMVELIVELLEKADDKGYGIVNMTMVDIGVASLKNYSKKDMIEGFIGNSIVHWEKIHVKDEKYIEEHVDDIFKAFPMGNVKLVRKLLTIKDDQGVLIVDTKDREDLWAYIQSQVKISIDYIHNAQHPNCKLINDKKQAIYQRKYTYKESYLKDNKQLGYRDITLDYKFFGKICGLYGYTRKFTRTTYT